MGAIIFELVSIAYLAAFFYDRWVGFKFDVEKVIDEVFNYAFDFIYAVWILFRNLFLIFGFFWGIFTVHLWVAFFAAISLWVIYVCSQDN